MPLRTSWEHLITNTSHGPGLFCPSPGKKRQMNEKKIGKRKENDDI